MKNIILFGPPGSGKGTQAAKLVKKYKLLHISTGDLFRYELGNNTELGQLAKSFMDKGALVPDEVTVAMLKRKVEMNPDVNGYIFDGFPRTVNQAVHLDYLLKEKKQKVSALIALDVDDEEIVKRLLLRGETSGRPDDKNEKVIRQRINVYKKETSPVFGYYDLNKKSTKVDGIGSLNQIFNRLCEVIDKI